MSDLPIEPVDPKEPDAETQGGVEKPPKEVK